MDTKSEAIKALQEIARKHYTTAISTGASKKTEYVVIVSNSEIEVGRAWGANLEACILAAYRIMNNHHIRFCTGTDKECLNE